VRGGEVGYDQCGRCEREGRQNACVVVSAQSFSADVQ
jgi:hypothetical protein